MTSLHSGLFIAHIILGSMALILFWLPIVTKKGSLDHQKFGRHYGFVMYAVALTGALMALLVIWAPVQIKGHILKSALDPAASVYVIRIFWGFLLYLSLITYVSVRQGFAVSTYKQNRQPLRTLSHLLPIVVLILAALTMLWLGLAHSRVLHSLFAVLGILIGFGMLRYIFKAQCSKNEWIIEHFSAMIGSGIGAYTAYFAFGGRHLFENLGQLQLIFWVVPGLIGALAILRLSRKYQRQQPS